MQTNKKILIVDEDSTYISGLRKGLSQSNHEVIYWDDGRKALEIIKNLQPDLIIADVELPQISGHEFFKEIKSNPETRNVPFIFLSNQKRVDDRIKSMEMGVDGFITKPFYVEEVVARIESLLNEVDNIENSNHSNEKGFSGNLYEMNLIDLIQTLELGKKSGIINLKHLAYEGRVYVLNGEVIDATFEDFPPKEALFKMSLWTEGNFFVEMTQLKRSETISQKNKELIPEVLKRINQWEQIKKNLPPLDTVLAVNQITIDESSISDEEQRLLSSLNGNQMIYDIVIKSPFDDLKALELVHNLYQRGHLQETNENYMPRKDDYSIHVLGNSNSSNNKTSYIISNLLKKSEESKSVKVERRMNQRRRLPDRRQFERRKDQRTVKQKILFDKTELLMIREKLI